MSPKRVANSNHIHYGCNGGGGHLHGYGWIDGGTETPRDIALLLSDFLNSTGEIERKKQTLNFSKAGIDFKVHLDFAKDMLEVKTFHPVSRR